MADNEEEVEMTFTPTTESTNELIPIIELQVYLLSVYKELDLDSIYDKSKEDVIKAISKAWDVIKVAQDGLIKKIKEKDKQITL